MSVRSSSTSIDTAYRLPAVSHMGTDPSCRVLFSVVMSAPFGDGCVGASIVDREVAGAPCLQTGRYAPGLSLGHQARGFSFVRRGVHASIFLAGIDNQ